MKHILFAMLVSLTGQFALAHGAESRVALEPEVQATTAGKIIYQFQLVDTKNNKLITDQDLNILHEKKLHFLAYDPSLTEFSHVHPTFDGTFWNVELNIPRNGDYWLWAQGELSIDKEEFSAPTRLAISGGMPAWPTPPALIDSRSGSDGNSVVTLSSTKITAGKMTMLNVVLSRNDGSQPQITPYLGAFAHIVAVPADADSLLHVHPMNGSKQNEGMLHATFPTPGLYRLWVQFMDGGVLRTIPLSLEVF